MAASVAVTLQVRLSTQKRDKVAVTGSHTVLGEWDPTKVVFLKPKSSIHDSDIWFVKINIPLSCAGLEYRYLVCRKYISAHGDEAGEETHIIRHWEAGVFSRYKSLIELGSSQSIDVYGEFQPDRSMFLDQGWLIDDTEIQLRFYKDPLHLFKKRDQANQYNIKCCAINLFNADEFYEDAEEEERFSRSVHASNPPIRVSSLGKYNNLEQSNHGMTVSSTDYVIYKLKTFELNSHGIKVTIYRTPETVDSEPTLLGYTNMLPLHLEGGTGSVVLVVNDNHGFPIGHLTVRYLVCKPNKLVKYDLKQSFSKWWNRERSTLEIGHRGLGDTHSADINSKKEQESDIAHENTLNSFMTAAESGADYVEFDVMLSKDKIPIIWHDFKVSILLRKKTRGRHQVYHIPVHELTLSQLKDLRVEFAKNNTEAEHSDLADSTEEHVLQGKLSPFPTLKEALHEVDRCVGFYVEIKYPQLLHNGKSKEEGIESSVERNAFLDPILKVLHEEGADRRIILASFDPDICIMARLKQNRYPVILLIEDNGRETPYYHDMRTHSITRAVAVAKSEKFLGLSVNAAALLRREEKLLEYILSQSMICFVWGPNANNIKVRQELRERHVHAICHDEIGKTQKKSIYRAEHEDRIQRLTKQYQAISPGISPAHSRTGSATNLGSLESLSSGSHSSTDLYNSHLKSGVISSSSGNHILPTVRINKSRTNGQQDSCSDSSLDKLVEADFALNGHNASTQDDYRTDFY